VTSSDRAVELGHKGKRIADPACPQEDRPSPDLIAVRYLTRL